MKVTKIAAVLLLTTALAGCDLAPNLHIPGFKNDSFKEAASAPQLSPEEAGSWKVGQPSASLPRGEWWRVFNDESLNALEDSAQAGNENLKAMVARVEQARAAAQVASSYLWPQIDNTTSAARRQINAAQAGVPAGSATFPVQNDIGTIFGLSYEIDLFGTVRNERKAAIDEALSAQETLQSMRLALQADVADMYFGLQALDREINILERGVQVRADSVDILRKRVTTGQITELDLSSNVVDLETTRTQLQQARSDRAVMEHALAVLVGKAPADFNFAKKPLTAQIPVVPAGIPSSVLERRPDISAAQHDLAAANARIGVAKAAFFPRISLTGTGGFESTTLPDLFKWSSRTWSIGPSMSLPIFTGGRNTANLAASKASYDEYVARYREQVLEAFRDVEDSLTQLKSLSEQAQAQRTATDAAKQAEKIANLRYDSGDLGYLETISARRDALATERSEVQVQQARLSATIRLIRSLGGSWDAPVAPPASEDAPMPISTSAPAAPVKAEAPKEKPPTKFELKPATDTPLNQ